MYNIADGGQNNINIWNKPGHKEFIIERQKIAWTEERKKEFAILKNPSARKIMCLETGEVFNCARDAVRKYNLNAANLSMCCHGHESGKYNRKTSNGQHWIFYTKDLTEEDRKILIMEIGTPSSIGDGNPNSRAVTNISTGTIYNTMAAAAKSVSGNANSLKVAINKNRAYKGFYWEQVKDD